MNENYMDQKNGYVFDVPYNAGFYKELTPSFLRAILLLKRCDLPERDENEPLRYLELGFGQGNSFCIHAASNTGDFWGTDFNPTHATIAQKSLNKSNTKAHVLCDSFEELANKSEKGLLPDFDIIVLHGIWSWISEENREQILKIISHSLKINGIVYASYNALPGTANFHPVRDFFMSYSSSYTNPSLSSVEKLQASYDFLKALKSNGSLFFEANPAIKDRFDNLEQLNPQYLVHEYMNSNWTSFYFKDVAQAMKKAKCFYLSSARILSALPHSLPENIRNLMLNIKDVDLIETIRDYTFNTQFRCDIFAKGYNILDHKTAIERLHAMKFVLLCQPHEFTYKVAIPTSEVSCKEELYKPILEFLASDNFSPKSVKSISEIDIYKGNQQLTEVLSVLLGAGVIHPAPEHTEEISQKLQEQCLKLNAHILENSLQTNQALHIASPTIGSGIQITTEMQLFAFIYNSGHTQSADIVKHSIEYLQGKDISINIEQNTLKDNELREHIEKALLEFEKRIPLYKALKIII